MTSLSVFKATVTRCSFMHVEQALAEREQRLDDLAHAVDDVLGGGDDEIGDRAPGVDHGLDDDLGDVDRRCARRS